MKVVRTSEQPWKDALQRGAFAQRRKALGGERLTCSLWELAPGKRSFPMHVHHVTEEAMFVVSGRGKVRTPEGETPIGPGDYVSFPAGALAHQLVNDSSEPLVYVGMAAVQGSDVVEYPESQKVACTAGGYPATKRYIFRTADQADYFDGEPGA